MASLYLSRTRHISNKSGNSHGLLLSMSCKILNWKSGGGDGLTDTLVKTATALDRFSVVLDEKAVASPPP